MPEPKPRSRWPFVFLGCGIFFVLIVAASALGIHKFKQGLTLGLTDTNVATATAVKYLGSIPPEFKVTSSIDLGLAEATMMTKGAPATELFVYFRLARDDMNSNLKDFFTDATADISVLQNAGVVIDATKVESRGTLEFDSRKILFAQLIGQAQFDGKTQTPAKLTALLFECSDDRFHVGVFAIPEATPHLNETQLKMRLKDTNPCGRTL
jgi:hypothetical protein